MASDHVVSVILKAQTGTYKRDMNEAANATDRFGNTAAPTARKTDNLAATVTKLAGYTYAAKKGFDATVGAAISWESAFAGVTKTVSGTSTQLAEIEDGLRAMSKEIPTSAAELANIAASAGQLGIETPNVLEFTRVIADLGETTNLSGEQAATQLARLANITQMSQQDFDRLGSTIVELGNNFQTTEAEIVEMGMRIAGAGHQIGLSEHQILALSTALSSVGIEAEAGGSAISKVMIEIASQVENGGDKLELFARTAGMSAEEFSQAWREDAAGALVTFITGLGDTEAQGMSTLQVLESLEITEVRMRDALLRTSSASDVLNESLAVGEGAWDANTALAAEAAVRYDTAASNIEELKNTFVDLGVTIGNEVLPALSDATSGLTTLLNAEKEQITVGESMTQGFLKLIPGLNGYKLGSDDAADATGGLTDEFRTQQLAQADSYVAWLEGRNAVGEHTLAQADAQAQIDETTLSLAEQHELMLASVDPVFALTRALGDVEDAQAAYNDAVDEYGASSDEAEAASMSLVEAISKAEAAAVNGDMSFSEFDSALRRWVDAGRITAEQASIIRGRVQEAREEAEAYAGDYRATISMDTTDALNKIFAVRDELRRIPNTVSVSRPTTRSYCGARAEGGPVDPNHWYTVGERGPETFVPATAGHIIPAGGDGASMPEVRVFIGNQELTDIVKVELRDRDRRQMQRARAY